MLNIHESVTKVEDLLEINTDTPAISVTSDERLVFKAKEMGGIALFMERTNSSLGKQIERVAIEYNQMQHLVKRGKHLPFMAENEWVTFIYTYIYTSSNDIHHPCHSVSHGSRTLCRASYQGRWNLLCDNCRRANRMTPPSNL